jgi:hypothetical protein
MPVLPTQSINTNAPDMGQGPSLARAGASWDAVTRVGQVLNRFGTELAEKRKKAETSSYVNTAANDFERFISDKESQLQADRPGDPTGYAAAVNEAMNSWYEEKIQTAPNDDAKAIWEQKFASASNTIGMRAEAWENQSRAKYQVGLMDESVIKDGQHLVQKPDPTKAAQFITNTSQMVNDGIGLYYDEMGAKDKMQKFGSSTATSLFEGLEASKNYSVGMNVLNGKDPNSKIILGTMDPKQIAVYKDRFARLASAEADFSKRVFNTNFQDTSFALEKGQKVSKEIVDGLASQMNLLKPEERQIYADDLQTSLIYNQKLQDIKTMPIQDAQALANFNIERGNDIFNSKSRAEKQAAFSKNAAEIVSKRLNDAPTFYTDNDPMLRMKADAAKDVRNPVALKDWVTTITAKQEADDVSSPKILNKSLSASYGAMLKSGNPDSANAVYMSMKAGTGDHFGNAVSDMVKNGDIEPAYAMGMFMSDDKSRMAYLGAVNNKKQIEESYKSKVSADKSIDSTMKELASEQDVQDFTKAIMVADSNGDRLWLTNAVDESLQLSYKAAIAQNLSPSEAKEKALDVIRKSFSVATAGSAGSVIISKDYDNRKSVIEDFMSDSIKEDRLKVMDLQVPKSYNNELIDNPKERYIKDLSQSARWVSNSAQNGAILTKRNVDGSFAPVRDSSGKQIEVHFNNMTEVGTTIDQQIKATETQIAALEKKKGFGQEIKFQQERLNQLKRQRMTF